MYRSNHLSIIALLLLSIVLPELSHAQLTLTSKDLPRAINETITLLRAIVQQDTKGRTKHSLIVLRAKTNE